MKSPKMPKLVFFLVLSFLSFLPPLQLFAQESILDVGIRVQKTLNLYWENGISAQFSHKNLKPDQLYFGISYASSRLGTALNSNAIKQDNFLFSSSWFFKKEKALRPMTRMNLGYFIADYESSIFDMLPNSSILLSPEIGLMYANKKQPVKVILGFGYNLITGDGTKGAGTIYPLFTQTTVSWTILKK